MKNLLLRLLVSTLLLNLVFLLALNGIRPSIMTLVTGIVFGGLMELIGKLANASSH